MQDDRGAAASSSQPEPEASQIAQSHERAVPLRLIAVQDRCRVAALAAKAEQLAFALEARQAAAGAPLTPRPQYFGGQPVVAADGEAVELWLWRALRLQRRLPSQNQVQLRLLLRLQWKPLDGLPAAQQWSLRLQAWLARRLVLQQLTHVVSTLGGAHSQLGESSRRHAHQAQLRARQMQALAVWLDDEGLACRCRAYRALAWIQLGKSGSWFSGVTFSNFC